MVERPISIVVEVNGLRRREHVMPRLLLSDFLRHRLGLTGTHVGCEHGVCGACTVRVDGIPARACLMFAVQTDGCAIETVEGLAGTGELTPLQRALHEAHGLQCGFCTPGILIAAGDLLERRPGADRAEIEALLSGHVCRCTGYRPIVDAIERVARDAAGHTARGDHADDADDADANGDPGGPGDPGDPGEAA
ncbi:MAG: (2Fe-2S)-binding protein [Solirubrobacterales bacterium]|nr:(2Fe-2S)-binding protein [Solirubrobacterales bacterium]